MCFINKKNSTSNLLWQYLELTLFVFPLLVVWIWSHTKPGSSQRRPVQCHFNTWASGTHCVTHVGSRCAWQPLGVFADLSRPPAPHPTARSVHRPEHLESDSNKKGKVYMLCAWDSGTSGHVPFHRLSWTLPSTWTLRPLTSSPQRLEATASNPAVTWIKRKTCLQSFLNFVHNFKVSTWRFYL